ncbi:hypothetical protein [Methylobacter svalbardensis]|uniref:hypothetical protein n=1 Tax=Methylobacter svalbardensis TaxID=3080016 RepID=UPI0030EF1F95
MTNQSVQKNPSFNLGRTVTPGTIEAFQANRSTVTLIYINMHVRWPHYRKGTAL